MKVERDGHQDAAFVQRGFEEFHELHSKLRLLFPSSKLPRYTYTTHTHSVLRCVVWRVLLDLTNPVASRSSSFPSRFVIGRSRGEAMAERRKEELNGYVWHLMHAAPEVAQVT